MEFIIQDSPITCVIRATKRILAAHKAYNILKKKHKFEKNLQLMDATKQPKANKIQIFIMILSNWSLNWISTTGTSSWMVINEIFQSPFIEHGIEGRIFVRWFFWPSKFQNFKLSNKTE